MADRPRGAHTAEPLRPGSAFVYLRRHRTYLREPNGVLAVVDVVDAPVVLRLLDAGMSLDAARAALAAATGPLSR